VRFDFFCNFYVKMPHSKNNSSRYSYYQKCICIDLHVKDPLSGLIEFVFSLQFFNEKIHKFDKNAPQLEPSSLRAGGRTDMTKPIVGFAILR